MRDESVCWTKKLQQAARNFNHLNENPRTKAKSGKIKSSFGVFQQTASEIQRHDHNHVLLPTDHFAAPEFDQIALL
jgi:hypothetical protein